MEYFDFDLVVDNDVALQTSNSAPATFDTLADGVGSPQVSDALGRVPDALAATFDAPDSIPGLTFENPWNPVTGYAWSDFVGFALGEAGTEIASGLTFDPLAHTSTGIQEPSFADFVGDFSGFGHSSSNLPSPSGRVPQYGTQQAFAPLDEEAVKAEFQCLDPSTLLHHQPVYNLPGALGDAGSSPTADIKTEPLTDDLVDGLLPVPHPSWGRSKRYREDSVSVDGSDSSSFHTPVHFMSTPALTPSTTPAPSVVDSAGPATPYHYLEELEDDDVPLRHRNRGFSRGATPFAFDTLSSEPSSRSSSLHPNSPEPCSGGRLPSIRIPTARGRSLKVKTEDGEGTGLIGCLRSNRQDSVKVPWPERRKRIDERTTVWTTVKGKRKLMYQCDYCGKLLGRHPDLHRHEKTHFIAQKTLCCDIVKDLDGNVMEGCGSTFSRLDALERHRKGVCERQRADVEERLLTVRADSTMSKTEKEFAKQEIKRLAAKRALPKAKQAAMESSTYFSSPSATASTSRRRLSRS